MGIKRKVTDNVSDEKAVILRIAEDLKRGFCEYAFESNFLGIGSTLAGVRVSVDIDTLASAILYLETGKVVRFKKPFAELLIDFDINSVPSSLRSKLESMCTRGDLSYDFLELDSDGVYKTSIELSDGFVAKQVHNPDLINGLALAIMDYQ